MSGDARVSPNPPQTCPHGDPLCPCQDQDSCHYEDEPGTPRMPCYRTGRPDCDCGDAA